ncbi:hypothetical protein DYB36_011975 [Aphanomyces astaci]|uniref:SGNH hydrolase-type esterase domain-containing protein n=1 Tax=Aphanomyces astaci TaxID=112090 RepID=A0A397BSK2_APHAT|nr:hypothetical protein DYB36_011975 [Aphanomyces astaci]
MQATDSHLRRYQVTTVLLSLLVVTLSGVCITLAVTPTAPSISRSNTIQTSSGGMPVLVIVGDSNTELGSNPDMMGYESMLAHAYVRKADVINRGNSGWTTRSWLKALPVLMAEWTAKAPSLVLVFLGTNDACLKDGASAEIHVPLDEYRANLQAIVSQIQSPDRTPMLFVTPPAFDDTTTLKWDRTNADVGKYAAAMMDVGAQLKIPVVDLYTPLQTNVSSYFFDGLHLNRKGNMRVYDILTAKIQVEFPSFVAHNLATLY